MATYNEQLQHIYHEYSDAHGGVPATLRSAVEWAVEEGLIVPQRVDPLDKVIDDMGRALREEQYTDSQGRRFRRNHAARITRAGVQFTLWAEMESAPREHMQKSFADRRNQIVGECVQLATDVAVYNDLHRDNEPIQMVLDFTQDVNELRALAAQENGPHSLSAN